MLTTLKLGKGFSDKMLTLLMLKLKQRDGKVEPKA